MDEGGPEWYMYQHPSGSVECKLCLSVHASTTSYLSHAQGKRHLQNVAVYGQNGRNSTSRQESKPTPTAKKKFDKIGIPKYDLIKIRDPASKRLGLRVELQLPKLKQGVDPMIRLMNAYEQNVEEVNTKYQYLVIAAEPYESVALRLPAAPINEETKLTYFDPDQKVFYVQFMFTDALTK